MLPVKGLFNGLICAGVSKQMNNSEAKRIAFCRSVNELGFVKQCFMQIKINLAVIKITKTIIFELVKFNDHGCYNATEN